MTVAEWANRLRSVTDDVVAGRGNAWQVRTKRLRALAPATTIAFILVPLGLVLDLTGQGRDVVTSMFEGSRFNPSTTSGGYALLRAAALVIGLIVSSSVIWLAARRSVVAAFDSEVDDWPVARWPNSWVQLRTAFGLHWYTWMPRLLAALPFVFVAIPLFVASEVRIAPALVVVLSAVAIMWILKHFGFFDVVSRSGRRSFATLAIVAVFGFAMMAAVIYAPVELPRLLGAPTVALLAVGFIVATVTCLYRLLRFDAESTTARLADIEVPTGRVRYLPLGLLLVVAASLFSLFNDNHVVNGGSGAIQGPSANRPPLTQAFEQWLQQVPRPAGADEPIPIIFIATAGGASRAAYWTGVVLGKLEQATGGRFGRHVFAVSSVSGGTLGAASYIAERAEGTPADEIAGRMAMVNGADHLAPAIAGMLFPDLLQRFLPIPVLPDRASALERSLEASWTPWPGFKRERCLDGVRSRATPMQTTTANRFARPFLTLWNCTKPGAWVPVMLANGARAEDGRRIVTSSHSLGPGTLRDALDFHDLYGDDVPLSVVVTNSARFPIISPAGTLPGRVAGEASRGHILDGGYFENGGIETAAEVAERVLAINAASPSPAKLLPVFIEINNDDTSDPAGRYRQVAKDETLDLASAVAHPPGLDALLDVRGLYNSRTARGTQEALRVQADWKARERGYHLFQLCRIWRGDRAYPTQMNWTLSDQTKAGLDDALNGQGQDPGCGWRNEVDAVVTLVLTGKPVPSAPGKDGPATAAPRSGRIRADAPAYRYPG